MGKWQRLESVIFCSKVVPGLNLTKEMGVSNFWKVLILGDGSTTRMFNILTDKEIQVDLLETSDPLKKENLHETNADSPPSTIETLQLPVVRRQIWLRTEDPSERLLYAVSWWREDAIKSHLQNPKQPIGSNFFVQKTETHRELLEVECGFSDFFSREFSHPGPFWARTYLFWNGERPITLIYEVFSPLLEVWLGPTFVDSGEKTPMWLVKKMEKEESKKARKQDK
eukprot:TRINITY_DN2249_c0_g1_i1.p1 TRINITY_DN2249_c0_g1~~TRINITY_DN2249_c0_g1_i1.p1  ORF type:complete len:226 (-),score=44.24 TRINITY_DN2249_c0_g1_i1:202-879(-)